MQLTELIDVLIIYILLSRRIPMHDLKEAVGLSWKTLGAKGGESITNERGLYVHLCDQRRDNRDR